MTNPQVSIVIPALNEEQTLQGSLPRLIHFSKTTGWDWEVLIVDDGSTDKTCQIVQQMSAACPSLKLLHHPSTLGKGWATRTGMLAAAGEFIIFMDADLAYGLDNLKRMVEMLQQGADLVIGSRQLQESRILDAPPWRRQLASLFFNLLVKMLFALPTADTQCGLKGFRRHVARQLFAQQKSYTFAFDVEILSLACLWGLRIQLIPVTLQSSSSSSVRFLKHGLGVVWDLCKIRWRNAAIGKQPTKNEWH